MAVVADLRHCSLTDFDIDPGSVDLVLTDPPYPAQFDPLLEHLAALCDRVLRDDGSAVVMLGQRQLPAAFAAFAKHPSLKYRWSLLYQAPAPNPRIWPLRFWSVWKPLIWFAKGSPKAKRWREDRVAGERAKGLHIWQQGTEPFIDLTLAFSERGELVCDPFLGAGTTAVAATLTGRRFVGCDLDADCIRKTNARLEAVGDYLRTAAQVPA